MILVTGGAGFIGSNFVLDWLAAGNEPVLNLDKLTYAGNLANLASLQGDARHVFVQGDIGDSALVARLLAERRPRAIVHFAAESHVDRSIHGAQDFIATNIVGTFGLLEAARAYWLALDEADKAAFRFLHVSTDEVYGTLAPDAPAFTEKHAYEPNSPYSASKAASDHLARAWHHTYGLPVLTTHCSNNYGPYHFPEKLIPLIINNILEGKQLPVYGDGSNVRDWLYVEDHCKAIDAVVHRGRAGEVYNVGGHNERKNIDIVRTIIRTVRQLMTEQPAYRDALRKRIAGPDGLPTVDWIDDSLITFVTDRLGHDQRYAIDPTKISTELGWRPETDFETGIVKTVRWNLEHQDWIREVVSGDYVGYYERMYAGRELKS